MMIVVPSRARPMRALEMALSAQLHAVDDVHVLVVIDDTDPELQWYRDTFPDDRRATLWVLTGRHRYTEALNAAAFDPITAGHDILGAFGDDVLFRTDGWDRVVAKTLATPGIAYGDDLIHGKGHPSAVFMSRAIIDALGWLALPATKHQWADDAWKRLGRDAGVLRYMPDVIVEHMHPAVGKAEMDETYQAVIGGGEPGGSARDFGGFEAWTKSGLAEDVRKVRQVAA